MVPTLAQKIRYGKAGLSHQQTDEKYFVLQGE
jgi:hypothetical protein